jgi:hypothetical protein
MAVIVESVGGWQRAGIGPGAARCALGPTRSPVKSLRRQNAAHGRADAGSWSRKRRRVEVNHALRRISGFLVVPIVLPYTLLFFAAQFSSSAVPARELLAFARTTGEHNFALQAVVLGTNCSRNGSPGTQGRTVPPVPSASLRTLPHPPAHIESGAPPPVAPLFSFRRYASRFPASADVQTQDDKLVVWQRGDDDVWRIHRDIWNAMPAG